jgi:triphosphatase
MTVPKEIEIKLELAPASVSRLRKVPPLRGVKKPARRETQVSVYFDTDKHKLRRKGLMLRVRRVGDRHIQTIKATRNSRLFERDEWESEIPGQTPDLDLARGTAINFTVTCTRSSRPECSAQPIRSPMARAGSH